MKLLLIDQRHGQSRSLELKGWLRALLSLCLLGTPVGLGYFGYQLAAGQNDDSLVFNQQSAENWQKELALQALQLEQLRSASEQELDALTLKLAKLQARLSRLDALGERVAGLANIDSFDAVATSSYLAGGLEIGIASGTPDEFAGSNLLASISELAELINERQQQLGKIEGLLIDQRAIEDGFVAGRPVENAWIASPFGRRPDPITGKSSFHSGIDLTTGKAGAQISSVAGGVVTWAGPRSGYGLMVEVNHGNGFTTRYAHSQELFVEVGDVVSRDDKLALVGSTGRSTGPHVHFEVYKNGRVVDPASYIRRTIR